MSHDDTACQQTEKRSDALGADLEGTRCVSLPLKAWPPLRICLALGAARPLRQNAVADVGRQLAGASRHLPAGVTQAAELC